MPDNTKKIFIITYLSILQKTNQMVFEYSCNSSDKIQAMYTNEAGIQYILRQIKNENKPYKLHIIYFVTEEVQNTKYTIQLNKERDLKNIKQDFQKKFYKEISYEEGNRNKEIESEKFFIESTKMYAQKLLNIDIENQMIPILVFKKENEAVRERPRAELSKILLKKILEICDNDRDADIYIDTSGGFRDDAYLYVLATKLLTYTGFSCKEIIYSKKNGSTCECKSILDIMNAMEITNGFHEFLTSGKVNTLQNCLVDCSPEIKEILNKMSAYANDLSICRWSNFNKHLEEINDSIKALQNKSISNEKREESAYHIENESDTMFKVLLNQVQERLGLDEGKGKKFIKVLNNCIENGLLQQAVTLYREQLENYLTKELGVMGITVDYDGDKLEYLLHCFDLKKCIEGGVTQSDFKENKKIIEEVIHNIKNNGKKPGQALYNILTRKTRIADYKFNFSRYVIDNIESYDDGVKFKILEIKKTEKLKKVLKDYVIIRSIRNKINHADSKLFEFNNNSSKDNSIQAYFDLVKRAKRNTGEKTEIEILKKILTLAVEDLEALLD